MLLIELALLPAIVLVVWIYRQDKVEKEPKSLLRKVFLFGVLSLIPAVILELLLEKVLLIFAEAGTLSYLILENFIGVALVEEFCKMKAARKAAWDHPAFDYKFDAIVYCVTSALGFAAIENVFYCVEEGIGLVVLRALLSVPTHAITGIIMGYFFGLAKEAELAGNKRHRKRCLKRCILVPTLVHGLYDFSLEREEEGILIFFFICVIAVDIWAFKFVKKQFAEDRSLEA